jgi:hypothetical protein
MKCLSRYLAVSFIYLVVIVLFFHVYFGSFSTALIGPPEDNMQDLWNTWYSQTKFDTDPSGFFYTNYMFYPQGASLLYHPFSYPNLAIMYLVRHIFGLGSDINTLIFLYNFFQLISFYFGAMGAYYLTRLFVKNETLAVISGFIFGFSPFHIAHTLHHMSVGAISFVPFFVYCFVRYMRESRTHLAAMSVLLWVLSALSCWYYLVYIGYFVAFYYAFYAVKKRSMLWNDMFFPIAFITFFVVLMLSPLIIPMILKTSPSSYAEGHNFYIADLLGFITFHPYHLLSKIGEPLYSHFQGNYWEMTVYIGLANATLLIVAFFKKYYRQIQSLDFCMACILFFMLFSLGSYLHIAGQMLYIPLPTLLTEYIPFFKNVRSPSRAVIFVYLFAGVSIAMIVEYYLANKKRAIVLATLGCLSIITFIDFYPSRLESNPVSCSPVYALINKDPSRDFGIINLPVSYIQNNRYMMYQAACSQKPMVNGSIGRKLEVSLIDTINMSDLEVQKDELKKGRIKYIVVHKEPLDEGIYEVHPNEYKDYDKLIDGEVALKIIDEYKNYYKLIEEDDFTALLQVY